MREDGWGLASWVHHPASVVAHYFRDEKSICGMVSDDGNRINIDVWRLGICKICHKSRDSEVNPE